MQIDNDQRCIVVFAEDNGADNPLFYLLMLVHTGISLYLAPVLYKRLRIPTSSVALYRYENLHTSAKPVRFNQPIGAKHQQALENL